MNKSNKDRFSLERSGTLDMGLYFDRVELVYLIRKMGSNDAPIRRYQLAEFHEAKAFLDGYDSAMTDMGLTTAY